MTAATASTAAVPAITRTCVSALAGYTYTPLPRRIRWPSTTAMAALSSPATKVTTPVTTALAASARPRRGVAVSVMWIRRRRYSAVMNIAPTTTMTISPGERAHESLRDRDAAAPSPRHDRSDVAAAGSVNVPAAWLKPALLPGQPPPPPTSSPAHEPLGQVRLTLSKTPVATLGPPLMLASPSEVCRYCGEVVNRPIWAAAAAARPG